MPAVTRVANFYPRSPCGERQRPTAKNGSTRRFLSTLSLRRATLDARESDYVCRISIHALLAESDVSFMLYDTSSLIFLSTLSLRRATSQGADLEHKMINFYPRSPCGERRMYHKVDRERACISIHALLAESDRPNSQKHINSRSFLSTLSLRRATPSF